MGEADTRVAGCALHHRATGLEQALLLRLQQDSQGGAVLHRAAGIHEFRLAQNFATGELAEGVEADEGGVADGTYETLRDATHRLGLPC